MNKKGQSIIEYTLIATLVIVGIMIMGPYVLRSINGTFKIFDESAQDSFNERIRQVPVDHIPNIPNDCICSEQPGDCGASPCAQNERLFHRTCNILGCDVSNPRYPGPADSCHTDDQSCCSQFITGNCGELPLSKDSNGNVILPVDGPPAVGQTDCYFGQRKYYKQCGDLSNFECRADNTNTDGNVSCAPQCVGDFKDANGLPTATLCPGADAGLTHNVDINYTSANTCDDPAKTCQFSCNARYLLKTDGTGCVPDCSIPDYVDLKIYGGASIRLYDKATSTEGAVMTISSDNKTGATSFYQTGTAANLHQPGGFLLPMSLQGITYVNAHLLKKTSKIALKDISLADRAGSTGCFKILPSSLTANAALRIKGPDKNCQYTLGAPPTKDDSNSLIFYIDNAYPATTPAPIIKKKKFTGKGTWQFISPYSPTPLFYIAFVSSDDLIFNMRFKNFDPATQKMTTSYQEYCPSGAFSTATPSTARPAGFIEIAKCGQDGDGDKNYATTWSTSANQVDIILTEGGDKKSSVQYGIAAGIPIPDACKDFILAN